MKVHYINILLFALPLNILADNKNKPSITPCHTPKIPTTRLLCECELYAPVNYDNDPQMKDIMQQFGDRTSQRFHEYDERMKNTRQKCKERCDKEIQKIILKDKLEKQMEQQLTTLETKINTDDIPACVCEKSMADKTEKFCLNCGKTMGGVVPGWGLISGLMYAGWSHYYPLAISKAAADAGMNVVIHILKGLRVEKLIPKIYEKISSTGNYANITEFSSHIYMELKATCAATSSSPSDGAMRAGICMIVQNGRAGVGSAELVSKAVKEFAKKATDTAEAAELVEAAKFVPKTTILTNTIIASVVAVVVIVLIMVIIYFILRYRRKKKMKKKLQYIKLLEE
ncbi:PIR protein, putative [Plasmodium sp. gorilla clade G1]|nr:PIR protein, putative [Plasmodium sp. gorilla clade G1]